MCATSRRSERRGGDADARGDTPMSTSAAALAYSASSPHGELAVPGGRHGGGGALASSSVGAPSCQRSPVRGGAESGRERRVARRARATRARAGDAAISDGMSW